MKKGLAIIMLFFMVSPVSFSTPAQNESILVLIDNVEEIKDDVQSIRHKSSDIIRQIGVMQISNFVLLGVLIFMVFQLSMDKKSI
jgi:hypothetical protein